MNHNNTFFLIILSFIFAMHDSFSAQLTLEEEKKIIEFQEKFQNEDVSVWFLEIYNYWLLALGKENYNYIAQKLYASLFSEIKNRINLIELSAKKNMLSSSTIQEEKLKAAYRDDDKIILEGTDENFLFPKNKTILLSNVKKLVPFLLLTCFPKKALTILNEEDIVRDSTNLVNSSIDNKKRLIIQLLKDAMKEKKINSYLDTNI